MIVRELSISTAAFYNHFRRSKGNLLRTMYDYYSEKLITPHSENQNNFEKLIDDIGPVEFINQMMIASQVSIRNPVLFKLSKVIVMEKEKNRTAAEISYKDRVI